MLPCLFKSKPKYSFILTPNIPYSYAKMDRWKSFLKRMKDHKRKIPLFLDVKKKLETFDNDYDKLKYINTFVNKNIKYKKDVFDYWQTPLETIQVSEGDCEDIALLKMYLAKKYAYPYSPSYLVVVKDTKLGVHHALAFVDDYVLDNQSKYITKIKDGSNRYKPIYKINENGLYIY